MYVAAISDKSPVEIIKEKGGITEEGIDAKIDECIANQLIKEDRETLTELGHSHPKGSQGPWRCFGSSDCN